MDTKFEYVIWHLFCCSVVVVCTQSFSVISGSGFACSTNSLETFTIKKPFNLKVNDRSRKNCQLIITTCVKQNCVLLSLTFNWLNHYFSHYFLLFTIKFITLFLFCFFSSHRLCASHQNPIARIWNHLRYVELWFVQFIFLKNAFTIMPCANGHNIVDQHVGSCCIGFPCS